MEVTKLQREFEELCAGLRLLYKTHEAYEKAKEEESKRRAFIDTFKKVKKEVLTVGDMAKEMRAKGVK